MGGIGLIDLRSLVLHLTLICAGFLFSQEARAQSVIFVDINAIGPTHDGSSWCSAYTSLTAAISSAVTGDEIRVADGLYKPGVVRTSTFLLTQDGVTLLGGFAGCGEPIPDDRHTRLHETILSCDINGDDLPGFINNGENCYHVLNASFRDLSTVIDGFTITGGNANIPPPGTDDRGGGIINKNPFPPAINGPTIRNCIIRGNSALDKGGGMYNDMHNVQLTNCLVVGNRAIFAGGIDNFDAFPKLTNCTIAYNNADGESYSQVGGMRDSGISISTMKNCILWGNIDRGGMDESAQFVSGGIIPPPLSHTTIQGFSTRFFDGTGVNGVDPQFIDPFGIDGVPGTDDDDWRLASTSPAINTGDPAFDSPIGADIDLDFGPRVQSCRVDRGPFESAKLQLANDYNADESIDLIDYADFQRCFATSSSASPTEAVCLCVFDSNEDAEISLIDYINLSVSVTGP